MVLIMEAEGGVGGNYWDDDESDNEDYEDVTKVYVRGGGLEGIQFIKFEYVKAGKTIVGQNHGVSDRCGFTQMFEINPAANEYLLSVEGYYYESTGVIQSLQFRTNTKTSDLMGYDKGTKFSLKSSGNKIIGFHGSAGNNLNSLGAYFIKIPSIKSAIQGGTTTGTGFDDGGDFDGVRKVYVTFDGNAVRHIKFDYYDKAGQVETRERGVETGTVYEFTVNHPNEYLESVEVTYDFTLPYGCNVLRSFVFKTSKGRISPLIGKEAGKKFVLESKDNAIVGFHGRVGSCVDGLGAYYNPSPLENYSLDHEDSIQYTKALKVEAKGGNGGSEWDDGSDNENITKIQVRSGLKESLRSGLIGIQSIKCDYAKDGKTFLGLIHGVPIVGGLTQTFEINHAANEYLLSVEGYYNESTSVIQSLKFKTNTKTSELMGYEEGTKFSLRASGRKIIGFHGFVKDNLNSLGAYFIKVPSTKSTIRGGTTTGIGFDDGGDFDGIRKVYVTHDGNAVRHIKIDYDKDGQVETRERGVKLGTVYEFVVDHPNEYLESVEVTYTFTLPYGCDVLKSFVFKTSKGRTSPVIGIEAGKGFVLESKNNAIVGFHGRVGSCVDGIGAYYNPIPPS